MFLTERMTNGLDLQSDMIDPSVVVDRRRPGRPMHVSAELIPLLRHAETLKLPPLDVPPPPRTRSKDGLRPMEGIICAIAFSCLLWAAAGGVAWVVLG